VLILVGEINIDVDVEMIIWMKCSHFFNDLILDHFRVFNLEGENQIKGD
jgi:hypothetical protein